MYKGFPGDPDSGSRGSSSPSIESQYFSSVDSFGSPPTTSAPQRRSDRALRSPHAEAKRMTALELSSVSAEAPPSPAPPRFAPSTRSALPSLASP
ncbi:Protein fosB [Liparis tanakae]|uniref:Protein fosB n=1 Tax=Liparis tanakae TaxID=230148 RepID=A0A4Z2ITC0_9TELE|nr:Protein fosB [Liparis tanakae]